MYGMKEGVNGQVDEQFEGRIPPQNLDAEQSVFRSNFIRSRFNCVCNGIFNARRFLPSKPPSDF